MSSSHKNGQEPNLLVDSIFPEEKEENYSFYREEKNFNFRKDEKILEVLRDLYEVLWYKVFFLPG